ncbi:3a3088d6-d303-4cf5-9faf-e19c685c9a19 [Sclerotinia trifoliorum]|uniref:3a3088d6-d303-4cf5-9faf-e19c685c9a19 n=1 Tax=Sclerotinia trifoliorum TaxID=28548 RepID=A0A8H2VU93_9HELO|nr:3a3088d6-d303-4cf5-9faf-e19c685c9a19 [Sclerotinia trifoliorum]
MADFASVLRLLAESNAKLAEERSLREAAEAKSDAKLEEERRRHEVAEADAKAKLEEERRRREVAEADAKAKLEEERRRREVAEADAKAKLEEERRRREVAEADAKAKLEEERRRREVAEADAKAKLEEERRRSEKKNLIEYLEACHDLSSSIKIIKGKTQTTQGDTTKPFGRPFPQRIVPWDDFPKLQEDIWEKLSSSAHFHSKRIFPSSDQLDLIRSDLDPISSEIGLRSFACDTVERPVRRLIQEVYKDVQLREQLQLHGTMIFESHTNLGEDSEGSIEESMENLSITQTTMPKNGRRKAEKATPQKKRAPTRRAGIADQFCIYEQANTKKTPIVSIEYKAPHKFPLEVIVAGLKGEIRPAEEVINKEGDGFGFTSKYLVVAVITQLFSYMIDKCIRYGYVFVGDATIFLHISDDPSTVYYYLSVPSQDFQEDDENRLHRTTVAQVFAFTLGSLAAEAPGQAWNDAAAALETWDIEYINILDKIPPTEQKKGRDSPAFRAVRWKNFGRSPIRTRSTRQTCRLPENDRMRDDGDQSDEGDDGTPPTPTPTRILQTKGQQPGSTAMSSSSKKGASKENAGVKPKPRIEDRPYCTHQCLLGLAYGGSMDQQCPNLGDHKKKHISRARFLRLIRDQLATDRGSDADCKPLYIKGSRGAMFKVRLSSHGYTLVAKGMQEYHRDHLLQESKVYERLRPMQGCHIPVCLGMIEPKLPYYFDCGVYVTLLFLSWAGQPIFNYLTPNNEVQILEQATSALKAMHRLEVLHTDAELRNMVWDEKRKTLMLIDFERAQIRTRLPLGTLTLNRKRDQQGKMKNTAKDDFAREIGIATGFIRHNIQDTLLETLAVGRS